MNGSSVRVAILIRRFGSRFGGAERYAVEMANALRERFNVFVFAQEFDQEYAGLTITKVPLLFRRPRWINQLWFAVFTWWCCRKNFDVIHSHELTFFGNVHTIHVTPVHAGIFAGLVGWGKHFKQIAIWLSPRLFVYWLLEYFRIRSQDGRRLIAVSELLKHSIVESHGQDPGTIDVIEPGVSMGCKLRSRSEIRADIGLPVNAPLLLFIANNYRKKGFPTLLESLQLVPLVRLVAISADESLEAMRSLVEDAGLGDRVILRGQTNDITAYYECVDCLVHPTLEDSFGMVVIEALAHGLPVIVSAAPHCGIANSLIHREDAIIVDNPRDPCELRNAITLVLTDPALRSTLIESGLRYAGENTWQSKAIELEKVYRSVLKNMDN